MPGKAQLDFILNPTAESSTRTPVPMLPSLPFSSFPSQPACATSPTSVGAWDGERAVLTALLHTPRTSGFRRKRLSPQQLPRLDLDKKRRLVLPSLLDLSLPTSSPVAATSCESSDDDCASVPTLPVSRELSPPRHTKKKTRLCKEKGCTSLAVSRRSCVRHGGGSRCTFEGCTNGAKLRNRCFQHGGSTICLAAGCNSKAKRYGYCWSHGGGRICSAEGCVKVAAQGGSCWAHGGGNRCRLEGCSKRSYQKYGYHCKAHAAYNV